MRKNRKCCISMSLVKTSSRVCLWQWVRFYWLATCFFFHIYWNAWISYGCHSSFSARAASYLTINKWRVWIHPKWYIHLGAARILLYRIHLFYDMQWDCLTIKTCKKEIKIIFNCLWTNPLLAWPEEEECHLHMGAPSVGWKFKVGCIVSWATGKGGPWDSQHRKLALGMWNVTMGNELELVS